MSYGKRSLDNKQREALQQDNRRRVTHIFEDAVVDPDGRCGHCYARYSDPHGCRYCLIVKPGRQEP